MSLRRFSSHPLVGWWRRVDRLTVGLVIFLMLFGVAVALTASPAVSARHAVDPYYFAWRQGVFVILALPVMLGAGLLSPQGIKIFGISLAAVAFVGVVLTLLVGVDVKGAHRWLRLTGFSLQPSEFLKPGMVILTAFLLTLKKPSMQRRGLLLSMGILMVSLVLVLMQPDFGMALMLCAVWGAQVFLSGILPPVLLASLVLGGLMLPVFGFLALPHVRSRFMRFFDPASGDTYQVDKAREALLSGGFAGRGAGEGVVKHQLPDAHTDFIFAVVGEEFGLVLCLLVLTLFAIIVYRSFSRVLEQSDPFVLLAGCGLVLLFALQVLVNTGVVLQVLPTTGMALPFVSYGGSAALANALTIGFLIALTTRKKGKSYATRRRAA